MPTAPSDVRIGLRRYLCKCTCSCNLTRYLFKYICSCTQFSVQRDVSKLQRHERAECAPGTMFCIHITKHVYIPPRYMQFSHCVQKTLKKHTALAGYGGLTSKAPTYEQQELRRYLGFLLFQRDVSKLQRCKRTNVRWGQCLVHI
jgi:hypothetical protein